MANEWTYFVQAVGGGPVKIGFTSQQPEQRLANLQTGSPAPLQIVGVLPGNYEKELHNRFADSRMHGEWFTPCSALMSFIAKDPRVQLQKMLNESAQLNLRGEAIPVVKATKPTIGESFFEKIIHNDDDIEGNLSSAANWNIEGSYCIWDSEIEEGDEDFYCGCAECVMQDVAIEICGERFIESVGINEYMGHIGFICATCNSRRRFGILESLACLAYEMDSDNGHWNLFAMFWDRGRQIGIDLLALHINGVVGNSHIFDPQKVFHSDGSFFGVQADNGLKLDKSQIERSVDDGTEATETEEGEAGDGEDHASAER